MIEEFEEEVQELKEKNNAIISSERVILYGSSSFRLWETAQKDLKGVQLLNLAFGGSNLKACEYYFELLFKEAQPTQLILYCGDNDVVDGFKDSEVLNSFVSLYRTFRKRFPETPFTFVSIKPSPSKDDLLNRIQKLNKSIGLFLEKEKNAFYLDVHTDMLNQNGGVKKELFTEDDLHLNQEGYKLWKTIFRNYLKLNKSHA